MILERRAACFVRTAAVCRAGMSPETGCKAFCFSPRRRKAVQRTQLRDKHENWGKEIGLGKGRTWRGSKNKEGSKKVKPRKGRHRSGAHETRVTETFPTLSFVG